MPEAKPSNQMQRPELLDALARWATDQQDSLSGRGVRLSHRDSREHDKWCGTVELEATQRLGYLSLWSSGELDCQVVRRADDFYVLNEHRLVTSDADLISALTTFAEVVTYDHPARDG